MARLFDNSSNEYLDAGNPSALNLTGDEVSLSLWFKKASNGTEMKVIAKWADAGVSYQYLLSIFANKGRFAIRNDFIRFVDGTTTFNTGQWYHLAGCYTGSALKVYVNGVEEGSMNTSGNMPSTTAPVRLGAGSGGLGTESPFDGDLGHAAIWDRGLSPSEIESLANGISPLNLNRDNLIEYWPCNGRSPEPGILGVADMTLNGTVKSDEPPIPNSIVAP